MPGKIYLPKPNAWAKIDPEIPNARARTSIPTFTRESPPPSIFLLKAEIRLKQQ